MSIFKEISDILKKDGSLVLATVVSTRGSTPRKVGAKMIIKHTGDTVGTIGGGDIENIVTKEATRVFKKRGAILKKHLLDSSGDPGMICGGEMDVFIELIRKDERRLGESIDRLTGNGESIVLATVISEGKNPLVNPGKKMVVKSDGATLGDIEGEDLKKWIIEESLKVFKKNRSKTEKYSLKPYEGLTLFIDFIPGEQVLIVAGGGHIGKFLVEMGKMLGFNTVVVDDRKDYANRIRFPAADKVLCDDFKKAFSKLKLAENSNVVIVTHAHKYDYEVLREVISSGAGYIGCIGSRVKAEGTFDKLAKEGFTKEEISAVHLPAGLDLGDGTPAGIALSILTEIVRLRKKGTGISLSKSIKIK
ncbi:MAG: XdhC family protein [Candidatus Aerophobetes bacterium]|nr:XdhC family protein [Candidatus Aerophobetes bacterium]